MFYASELEFFRLVFKNMHIGTHIVTENKNAQKEIDLGLRNFLMMNEDYNNLFLNPWNRLKENTIYKITDTFGCRYIFILLPETQEKSVLIAGPYINSEITHQTLALTAEKYSLPTPVFSQLVKYFSNLTVITDERYITTLCNSLAETMWKGVKNFAVECVTDTASDNFSPETANLIKTKSDDPMLAIRSLEERYEAENRMIHAISQGKSHLVEQIFSNASDLVFEKRTDDPLRNLKNYLIISNTLMRKAAESGGVHPIYIDSISSEFAKKIEFADTIANAGELMNEMIKTYCSLVKTHSTKNYSPFVQKIVTLIDSDLTADLSLKRFAGIMNVNSSYLSALFKKETGKTLTEYVSKKRIEHAAYLLRTTNLQIQTVAQHSGIYDVNYFAKMFKKIMGKTPKEYRNEF